jgi:competence protein ComGC
VSKTSINNFKPAQCTYSTLCGRFYLGFTMLYLIIVLFIINIYLLWIVWTLKKALSILHLIAVENVKTLNEFINIQETLNKRFIANRKLNKGV